MVSSLVYSGPRNLDNQNGCNKALNYPAQTVSCDLVDRFVKSLYKHGHTGSGDQSPASSKKWRTIASTRLPDLFSRNDQVMVETK